MKETREIPAKKFNINGASAIHDNVLVEEPFEIYVNDRFYTFTMRLVGEEIPLAAGLCFTDGIIQSADDLQMISYCKEETGNRIDLYLNDKTDKEASIVKRGSHASYSSCGICGSELVMDAGASIRKIEEKTRFNDTQIFQCHEIVEKMQTVFKTTGGTHAAGIFDVQGRLLSLSEDVGRHNALDKAIRKDFAVEKRRSCFNNRPDFPDKLRDGVEGGQIRRGNTCSTIGSHIACSRTGFSN
jgi:FdhD protein